MKNIFKKKNKNPEKKSFLRNFLDFIKDLLIIILIIVFVRSFIMLPFLIEGQSMLNSYYEGEFIIVDKLGYINLPYFGKINKYKRGDVIVFRPHVNKNKEFFIKRLIGVEGDTIKIEGGEVYLQKETESKFTKLDEKYLKDSNKGATYISGDDKAHIYKVPKGSYFVMGDNRNFSVDSRACFQSCVLSKHTNYILENDIVGKVFFDLGRFYFNTFSFTHPKLGISTAPKFLSSPDSFKYE